MADTPTTSLFRTLPFGWSLLLILTTVTVVGLVLFWADRVVNKPGKVVTKPNKLALYLRIGLSVWLAVAYLLAEQGWLTGYSLGIQRLTLVYIAAQGLIMLPLALIPFRKAVMALPLTVPILCHIYRLIQEIVLWQFAESKQIPVELTFRGGNFDVHIGATALFVAVALYSDFKYARGLAIGWNIFGLLIAAITILNGLTYATQGAPPYPAGNVLAFFPMVWLPAFMWPMAVGLHLLSLLQLSQLPAKSDAGKVMPQGFKLSKRGQTQP